MSHSTSDPFAPGSVVDQYQVLRSLGRGGMGEVLLARDTQLGRRVALKVINPDLLGSEQERAQFLFEARATARFNHPHIVTLYGVGQHQGIPYMALEYLEGHTLRDRMNEGQMGEREAVRIAGAVADALEESHRHHVLHGDLKPTNVLIPKDGRVRVLDFGLARMVEAQDAGSAATEADPKRTTFGSPQYMAPEQWLDDASGEPADMWSLGVILFEMIAGRRPWMSSDPAVLGTRIVERAPAPRLDSFRSVRHELVELVARCLDKDAQQRPSAAAVSSRLRDLLTTGISVSREESPFRGLRPFSERHAHFFFGRDADSAAFLERMREEPILPVVGASGVGKSSFVAAGVIPRLREQGRWLVIRIRPGLRPFADLESALLDPAVASAGLDEIDDEEHSTASLHLPHDELAAAAARPRRAAADGGALADSLRRAPEQLNLVLHELANQRNVRVLLFVDQLEELYTLVEDESLQRRFMRALCTASDDRQSPVRVVFTVRDDFLGRLHQDDVTRPALSRVTVLHRPEPESMGEILLRPLDAMGYRPDDPSLVPRMVEEVHDEPACLPLLQFAAHTLWERRDRETRTVQLASYEAMGGVAGALASHADGVLDGLAAEDVKRARRILLRLVTPDGTRRVLLVHEVIEPGSRREEEVLARLVDARLVSVRRSRGEDEASVIELAHESLIRSWGRLARWIEESREELAVLTQLSQVAALWESRGCRREELWHGEPLTDARRALERGSAGVPPQVARFLEEGERKDRRIHRRRRLRVQILVALLALVAAISLGAAWFMGDREREARRQRVRAEAQRAEAQREGAVAALERGTTLEASAKLRMSLETEDSLVARALWRRIRQTPQVYGRDMGAFVYKIAWSPDGETVAAASQDHSIYLLDIHTDSVRVLRGHKEQVSAVAFSPDGKHLASGSWDSSVRRWNLDDGSSALLKGHSDRVTDVAFSSDGQLLATASNDRSVRLWQPDGSAQVFDGFACRNGELAFSPDGSTLAVGDSAGTVRLLDPASRSVTREWTAHDSAVGSVAFSADGGVLATQGTDHHIRVWDLREHSRIGELVGHAQQVVETGFLSNGLLVSASTDQTVRLWDIADGSHQQVIAGPSVAARTAALSPDRRLLAIATYDKAIRVWDLAIAEREERVVGGHTDSVYGVAFTPRGDQLATGSLDGTIRLWDVGTGRAEAVIRGHTRGVCSVAFAPDGGRVVSGSIDGTVRIWGTASGAELFVMTGHRSRVWGVAVSPDGRLAASAGTDRTVRLWDMDTGEQVRRLDAHPGGATTISFSADGRLMATSGLDDEVQIWDVRTGTQQHSLRGHEGEVIGLAFGRDGTTVVTGGFDHTVRLWDLAAGTSRVLGEHRGRVHGIALDSTGQRLATSSSDGTARIWDVHSGEFIELVGHGDEVNTIAFSADGALVASGGDDHTVRLWDATTGAPAWRGTVLLPHPPRLLSHQGWIPLTDGPPATGSQPSWATALAERAVVADAAGERLCLLDGRGELEVWALPGDSPQATSSQPGADRVQAVKSGCLTLAAGVVKLHGADGTERQLAGAVEAMGAGSEGIALVERGGILLLDHDGEPRERVPIGPGVTALAEVHGALLLGYGDGTIERRKGGVRHLEGAISSPVTRLAPGPADTILAGYANGTVGLWSAQDGTRLDLAPLHGPVTGLLATEDHVYAATALGDALAWDRATLTMPRCELLRQVWQEVPVIWESGSSVRRPPPIDHPCLP